MSTDLIKNLQKSSDKFLDYCLIKNLDFRELLDSIDDQEHVINLVTHSGLSRDKIASLFLADKLIFEIVNGETVIGYSKPYKMNENKDSINFMVYISGSDVSDKSDYSIEGLYSFFVDLIDPTETPVEIAQDVLKA